jgi:hypothetical protein
MRNCCCVCILLQWVVTVATSAGMELQDWQDAFDTLLGNALAQ